MKILGKPVTVERIKAAYKATGMQPIACDWIRGESCCALTAIYLADGGDRDALFDLLDELATVNDFFKADDEKEVWAFVAGFDNFKGSAARRCPEAYALGQEVRRAILGE